MPDDSKKTTTTKAKPAPAPVLARASESGDPAVHQLLAQLEVARANDDGARVAALIATLAELGFSA